MSSYAQEAYSLYTEKSAFTPTEATSISIAIAVRRKVLVLLWIQLSTIPDSLLHTPERSCSQVWQRSNCYAMWCSSVTVALPVEAKAANSSQDTEVNLSASKGSLSLSSNDLYVFLPNKKQWLLLLLCEYTFRTKMQLWEYACQELSFSSSSKFYSTNRCFIQVLVVVPRKPSHLCLGMASQIFEPNASRTGQFFTHVPEATAACL